MASAVEDGERAELLQAILDHPDDDAPRLVLADLLIERGDPRGEYISLACRLARTSPGTPEHGELEGRVNALMIAHRTAFAGEFQKRCKSYVFERGFVDRATMTASVFARWGDELSEREPIAQLVIVEADADELEQLAAAPALRRIRRLRITLGRYDHRCELAALAASPHLGELRLLQLDFCGHSAKDWRRLFAGMNAPRLEEVRLFQCHGSGHVYRELGRSAALPALHSFYEMQRDTVDGDDARRRTVAGFEVLAQRHSLRHLALHQCPAAGDLALAPLFLPTSRAALRTLELASCPISNATLYSLIRGPHAAALEELRLHDVELDLDGLRALLAAALPSLRHLGVTSHGWPEARRVQYEAILLGLPATHPLRTVSLPGRTAGSEELRARFEVV
jgi:uncharacterized protein (TIGR02996 family)